MLNESQLSMSGFDEMILLHRRFMQFIAILPFNERDYTYLATRLLLVFFVSMSIIHSSCYIFYIANVDEIPSLDIICEGMSTLGFYTRYYLLLWRRQELADLLIQGRAIWDHFDEDGHRAVCHFKRKVSVLFKGIFGSCLVCSVLYVSTAISLTRQAAHNNDTHKYLLFKWFTDNGEDLWPGYKFNFVLQTIMGLNSDVVLSTVDTAAPLLIMIGAGYFRALQIRIYRTYENAMMQNDNEVADQELVACVKLHQHILSYCSRIDKITRTLFFNLLLATVYNISLLGLKLAGTDPGREKYLVVAILNLGQLFLCQWAPDRLIDESSAISEVVYGISVPFMKRPIGKCLILMIARAQRPVQMTAAGVVYLSLENFGEMLKGAVSFFTVLRSFTV